MFRLARGAPLASAFRAVKVRNREIGEDYGMFISGLTEASGISFTHCSTTEKPEHPRVPLCGTPETSMLYQCFAQIQLILILIF
jgi:hypothetical protein